MASHKKMKKHLIIGVILCGLLISLPFIWTKFTVGEGPLISKPPTLENTDLKAYYGAPAILPDTGKYPPIEFPINTYLDPNRSGVHENTYNSDVTRNHGATGRNPSVVSLRISPILAICPSVFFDDANRIMTACISPVWVKLVLLDPITLDVLAEEKLPRKPISLGGKNNASGGGYIHRDNKGRIVVAPSDNTIRRYEIIEAEGVFSWNLAESTDLNPLLKSAGIDVSKRLDITDVIPDYQGRMWFTSAFGLVGYVDTSTTPVSVQIHDLGADMQNQIAIDPSGVYVVTVKSLNKLTVDPDGTIRKVWSQLYDVSAGQTGLVSTGSGTTPTLFGENDDVIAIADNAAEHLHLNLYHRQNGQLICSYPVFKPGKGGAENSPAGYGDEIVLPNNYGFPGYFGGDPFGVEPGLVKVSFARDENGEPISDSCITVWEKFEYKATPAPFFSTTTGLIYSYSVHKGKNGEQAWYMNLIDWETGESVNRTWVGNGPEFDNITAQIAITPDGGAVITTRKGLIMVRDN